MMSPRNASRDWNRDATSGLVASDFVLAKFRYPLSLRFFGRCSTAVPAAMPRVNPPLAPSIIEIGMLTVTIPRICPNSSSEQKPWAHV